MADEEFFGNTMSDDELGSDSPTEDVDEGEEELDLADEVSEDDKEDDLESEEIDPELMSYMYQEEDL